MRVHSTPKSSIPLLLSMAALFLAPAGFAQAPPEVTGLQVDAASLLTWDATPGADDYNVYRGLASDLRTGAGPRCHGDEILLTEFASPANPAPGAAFIYLVTAESDVDGEGEAGSESSGAPRRTFGACDPVMRNHRLLRLGYGEDQWTLDRYAALGPQGYLDEQLDPLSISEVSNGTLWARLQGIEPPADITQLGANSVVRGVYARRQLEQQATVFWVNHFNTNYSEIRPYFNGRALYTNEEENALTVDTQFREMQSFRDLAFNGTFREIVQASGLGPAMILYLDNDENIANRPNENYARELLELHTMGVNGGYSQLDVEEMARIWSGWNVCKKYAYDPTPRGPCLPRASEKDGVGEYLANFRTAQHDCGQKILFEGTPHEAIIPDTCADPAQGENDVYLALDAVVAHPATANYISTKLIQWFVTEEPTQAMIDTVVAAWNDPGNPQGVGDLREVLRAVLSLPEFSSPDSVGNKIKTPLEHVISTYRATRGLTNGFTGVRNYLTRLDHRVHLNPVPTGYPELGDDWLDTGNLLERQKWGRDLTRRTDPNYGTALTQLMADNGLTAASPPEDIINFWSERLFGGALTQAEIDKAIEYLTTDDSGAPSSPTDNRIRETVAFMMGYPHFLEQ